MGTGQAWNGRGTESTHDTEEARMECMTWDGAADGYNARHLRVYLPAVSIGIRLPACVALRFFYSHQWDCGLVGLMI